MPRYYFDIHDGRQFIPDEMGGDYAGPEEAREEAIRTLPSLAREIVPDGQAVEIYVTVRTEGGQDIARASLTLKAEWLE